MDIQFIRCDDLDIHICTGCCSCVSGMMSGKGRGTCIHKDDWGIVEEALMSSDAVIVGSPTYPDARSMKKRVGVLLTVGGARTENWLSFAMPSMFEFTMPLGIDVIDKYQYHGAMNIQHVLGRPDVMERMRAAGRHIVDALNAETEEERVRFRGEGHEVCPVCHESILTISHQGTSVECPVCGIEGTLQVTDGKIQVTFSEEQQKRSRLLDAGKWEHSNEIRDGAVTQKKVENLAELKKKYEGIGE